MKRKYPSNQDVRDAIFEALSYYIPHPLDFPEFVYKILKEKGFNTKFLTIKRIWRLYEEMVKKGKIIDIFEVIKS